MPDSGRVQRQYWDSCLFIYYLTADSTYPERARAVARLFERAERGEILVVVSTLVIAEVEPRDAYDAANLRIVDDLFFRVRPNVRVTALTPPIAMLARQIRAEHHQLRVPDAIHMATALLEEADVLHTYDGARDRGRNRSGDLLRYDGRISLGERSLAIEPPPDAAE